MKYICKFFHWQIIFSTDICLLFYSILALKYFFGCWNEDYEQIYYLSWRGYLQEILYRHIIFLSSLIGDKASISLVLLWLFLKFWVFNSSLTISSLFCCSIPAIQCQKERYKMVLLLCNKFHDFRIQQLPELISTLSMCFHCDTESV